MVFCLPLVYRDPPVGFKEAFWGDWTRPEVPRSLDHDHRSLATPDLQDLSAKSGMSDSEG